MIWTTCNPPSGGGGDKSAQLPTKGGCAILVRFWCLQLSPPSLPKKRIRLTKSGRTIFVRIRWFNHKVNLSFGNFLKKATLMTRWTGAATTSDTHRSLKLCTLFSGPMETEGVVRHRQFRKEVVNNTSGQDNNCNTKRPIIIKSRQQTSEFINENKSEVIIELKRRSRSAIVKHLSAVGRKYAAANTNKDRQPKWI